MVILREIGYYFPEQLFTAPHSADQLPFGLRSNRDPIASS